jgi:uncharacterized membrane protein YadS
MMRHLLVLLGAALHVGGANSVAAMNPSFQRRNEPDASAVVGFSFLHHMHSSTL